MKTENRDLKCANGRLYTKVNPAYMTRQVHQLGQEHFGVRGHITSLKPLRPGNAPDPWEREALLAFNQGATEFVAVAEIDSKPYLRFMRALIKESNSLKCHAKQGYKTGEIRGGLSVSVPLEPIRRKLVAQQGVVNGYLVATWVI